jgi:hypothetical protein
MLKKFLPGTGFILPLLAHTAVHGLGTFLIAMSVAPSLAIWLALLDMATHFVVDRIKASPNMLGRFKALSGSEYQFYAKQKSVFEEVKKNFEIGSKESLNYKSGVSSIDKAFRHNVFFWWSLGADQMAHHLTHYLLIYLMLQ